MAVPDRRTRSTDWAYLPSHGRILFADLPNADLVVDRVYSGGSSKTFADDPVGVLLPVGNQGGFRFKGSILDRTVRLVVLYTSGDEVDWPDRLDAATGDFTYYGDNRKPGHQIHETPRRGNLLLRDIFAASQSGPDQRRHLPPILLFQKAGSGRDVVFRGLLAPGSARLSPEEELVATWRTTSDVRFQNYRAHFTVLNVPRVSRQWLDQILAGNSLGQGCPREWEIWVRSRIYSALEAPPTVSVRTRGEQTPIIKDQWIIEMIHGHFSSDPVKFEHLAAEVWVMSDPNVAYVEVTRPSRDGGRDAIGTYRIGPGKDPIALEFALEAKCYSPGRGVGVRDVARLISRIRHRQFGIFVTTSFISHQVYREVREDGHPVAFVTGVDIVAAIRQMGYESPDKLREYLCARHPVGPSVADEVVVDVVYPPDINTSEIDEPSRNRIEGSGLGESSSRPGHQQT